MGDGGAVLAALDARDGGDHRGQHHDAGQLDDDRDGEGGRAGNLRGRDDLADVVHARADPLAELLVAEAERMPEQRQHRDRQCFRRG